MNHVTLYAMGLFYRRYPKQKFISMNRFVVSTELLNRFIVSTELLILS